MSVKIWCEACDSTYRGKINVVLNYEETEVVEYEDCPDCWDEATKRSLGYIIKDCGNCKRYVKDMQHLSCYRKVIVPELTNNTPTISINLKTFNITFCTAWEKKDEH